MSFPSKLRNIFVVMNISIGVTGCGASAPSRISSVALPGNPVISYPNGPDRVDTTLILSNPSGSVAGVDGRVFDVQTVIFNKPQDQVAIDIDGNVGARGSFHSMSMRSAKKDITPFPRGALGIIDATRIVSFRYRGESAATPKHIGIIADDAPAVLTGGTRRSFDLNNSLAVTIAATKELQREVTDLKRELKELRGTKLRR